MEKYLSLYSPQNWKGHIFYKVLPIIVYLGIRKWGINNVNLIIDGNNSFINFMNNILSLNDSTKIAVSLGSAGKSKKPVILLYDDLNRKVAICKIGWNKLTIQKIKNETEFLKKLERKKLNAIIPKVLYSNYWNDKIILAQNILIILNL